MKGSNALKKSVIDCSKCWFVLTNCVRLWDIIDFQSVDLLHPLKWYQHHLWPEVDWLYRCVRAHKHNGSLCDPEKSVIAAKSLLCSIPTYYVHLWDIKVPELHLHTVSSNVTSRSSLDISRLTISVAPTRQAWWKPVLPWKRVIATHRCLFVRFSRTVRLWGIIDFQNVVYLLYLIMWHQHHLWSEVDWLYREIKTWSQTSYEEVRNEGQRMFDIPTCFPLERCSLTSPMFPCFTQSRKAGIRFLKTNVTCKKGEKTEIQLTRTSTPC